VNKTLATVAAALAILSVTAPAGAAINARDINHTRLIDAGERSGKLTRPEVRTLRSEQRRIERNYDRFRAYGGYSRREKATIHRQQDALARHIDRLKANGRRN